jgi:hypothetical protein
MKFRSNHDRKFKAASRPMATVSRRAPAEDAAALVPMDAKAFPVAEVEGVPDAFPPGTAGCFGDLPSGTARTADFLCVLMSRILSCGLGGMFLCRQRQFALPGEDGRMIAKTDGRVNENYMRNNS